MDPVTVIGLVAVICLFLLGLGLVWFGMARRPSTALPAGADQLLEAVADGHLASRARVDEPARVTTPPAQLVGATTSTSSTPPAQPPRADHDTPAVRLVSRSTKSPGAGAPVVPTRLIETERSATGPASPMPVRRREPAQAPPVPAASASGTGTPGTASRWGDVRFDSLDEPAVPRPGGLVTPGSSSPGGSELSGPAPTSNFDALDQPASPSERKFFAQPAQLRRI